MAQETTQAERGHGATHPERRRLIEVFSAGCRACEETIKMVRQLACRSCEVKILDMKDRDVATLAHEVGIRSVPTVMITSSKLAACCASGPGPDEKTLRALGVGEATHTGRNRVIEIFSAGCRACEDAIQLVRKIACKSCEIKVLDMREPQVASLAKSLGVRQVPAVVITSTEIAACCGGRGPEASALKIAGLGQRIGGGD